MLGFQKEMRTPIPESEEQIVAECKRALSLASMDWPPTLPPSQYSWGAPEWYSFEQEAWLIGEGIRQAFAKQPKLRKSSIFGNVAEVACCRNLRRGRQSFTMALAYVAAREYAPKA